MSVAGKAQIARRPLLKGFLGAAGIAIVAVAAVEAPRFFTRRYPPSPFDDLLALLPDRDKAARLGASWLAQQKAFDAEKTARLLRSHAVSTSLADALDADLASARLGEAHGWVLPETLIRLCALAARAV